MKRGKRPFMVEVRRTGKRLPAGEPETGMSIDPDVLRRAEEALGQASAEFTPPLATAPTQNARPAGRILPNLTEPPPVVPMADEPEAPRRRGRPPGSRNKPKIFGAQASVAPGLPKRRGRPPKIRPEPVTRPMWQDYSEPVQAKPAPLTLRSESQGAETPPTGRRRRVSKILGRWVFGTMPTRGERWKRQHS